MPILLLIARSIPAGAGEPGGNGHTGLVWTVYPRGCGGTTTAHCRWNQLVGLSPRVRGNQLVASQVVDHVGSIPAGAGEPYHGGSLQRRSWVYPRGCGGTLPRRKPPKKKLGLSPRVRGNLGRPRETLRRNRSIPAGAGEPIPPRPGLVGWAVYPRGCGGTTPGVTRPLVHQGLSPRVRGNRQHSPIPQTATRSIPAGAGEPEQNRMMAYPARVYPRGCGGTGHQTMSERTAPGLSPRVRGNQVPLQKLVPHLGSIPAGAGEPGGSAVRESHYAVYPRGCGGTVPALLVLLYQNGLSPRVRGNPRYPSRQSWTPGSIPAGAGEPRRRHIFISRQRVYPRGCGGTTGANVCIKTNSGLSPRVRGNPKCSNIG